MNKNNLNTEKNVIEQRKQRVTDMEYEEIDIDPKYDIAFKQLFLEEKELMVNFLNNILKKNDEIVNVEFMDIEIVPVLAKNAIIKKNRKRKYYKNSEVEEEKKEKKEKEKEKIGKFGKLDLLVNAEINKNINENYNRTLILEAETKSNKLINIEIQFNKTGHMFKRSLYYASGIIFHSLPSGSSYNEIPNVIMINILNYNLFSDKDKCHWEFEFREKETNKGEGFEDLINIHFFELQKYKNFEEKELKDKYPWIFFLNEPNNIFFKNEDTPEIFIKARRKLLKLSADKDFRSLYEQRMKDWVDLVSTKNEGRVEERIIKNFDFAIKMYKEKFELEKIMNWTKLTKSEVEIIKNFLDNQEFKIKDLQTYFKIEEEEIIKICKDNGVNIEKRGIEKKKN